MIARGKQELVREVQCLLSDSKPEKILFDHLPKCGGSSLNTYLEAHFSRRKTFSIHGSRSAESVERFKNLSIKDRYRYDLIKGHHAHDLLDYVHPECIKVTVFRDPVDRIISHYYYVKRTPKHYLYLDVMGSEMSLEEYATSNLSIELRNWYTTHFSGLDADEIERNPEEAVSKAYEVVLNKYDIVGFLDNFSAFTEALRRQAKLSHEYRGEKHNVTDNRPSFEEVAQSTIKSIEEVNQLDISLFRRLREEKGLA